MPSSAFEAITSVSLSVSVDGPLGTPSLPIGQVDVGVASEERGRASKRSGVGSDKREEGAGEGGGV